MPPWLRDENGDDVFAGDGDSAVIDTTETFGDNPLTRWIDSTDDAIRDTVPQTSDEWARETGGFVGGGLGGLGHTAGQFVDAAADGSGLNLPNFGTPGTPWSDLTDKLGVAATVVGAGAALYLLGPVLDLAASFTDD